MKRINFPASITILLLIVFTNNNYAQITFSEHIAPIIYNNCTSCHRDGEIAPFPLTNYTEVYAFAGLIQFATKNRTMPPWQPDPDYSRFLDERLLTDAEIQKIQDWISAGAPQGDPALEPQLPNFPTGSQLGTPDLVLSMAQSFTHLGNDSDNYMVFVLPTGLAQDTNIKGIEFRAGNRNICHHAIIGVDITGAGDSLDGLYSGYGYQNFGGFGFDPVESNTLIWTPGMKSRFYPQGMGKKLYANSDVLVQIHYAPNLVTQQDSSSVNIYFADSSISRYINVFGVTPDSLPGGFSSFFIPANSVKEFHWKFTVPGDVSLIDVYPHSHLLGKSWKLYAVHTNGDTTNLIHIPDWDFNWQGAYYFPKLIKLETGTVLHAIGVYDNTTANPDNPNTPPVQVTWGEGTKDEMFLVFISWVPYQPGDENIVLTGYDNIIDALNSGIYLYQSYPNPANYYTAIEFYIPNNKQVTIRLFDIYGKSVATLAESQYYLRGKHKVTFNTSNLKNGLYFCRLEVNGVIRTKKMILSR